MLTTLPSKARRYKTVATMAIALPSERKPRRTSKATLKEKSDKPKRPLSAYNLFFRYQREKILRTTSQPLYKPRRSHGKIGFADLARSVADKWKALDESAKKEFHEKAATEKEAYERELEVWNHARVLRMASRCVTRPVRSDEQSREDIDFVYSKSPYTINEVSDDDWGWYNEHNIVQGPSNVTSARISSSFSSKDCDPLTIQGRWSFEDWVSHLDEECFMIMSALKQG